MKQERNKNYAKYHSQVGHARSLCFYAGQRPVRTGQNNSVLPKNVKTEQVRGLRALLLRPGAMERGSLHFSCDCGDIGCPSVLSVARFLPPEFSFY